MGSTWLPGGINDIVRCELPERSLWRTRDGRTAVTRRIAMVRRRSYQRPRFWTVYETRVFMGDPALFSETGPLLRSSRWLQHTWMCRNYSDGEWGYTVKHCEESEGPSQYDCPLRYLAITPECVPAWRACVIAEYARKRRISLADVHDKLEQVRQQELRQALSSISNRRVANG